jgi:hypothetical protein
MREAEGKALGIKFLAEQEGNATINRAQGESGEKTKAELEAIAAEAERRAEHRLREKADSISALARKEADRIIAEARDRADKAVLVFKEEAEQLMKKDGKINKGDLENIVNTFHQKLLSFSSNTEGLSTPPNIHKINNAQPVQSEAARQGEFEKTGREAKSEPTPFGETAQQKPGIYKGTVEIAIPPPIGLDRMLQLHKHLKQTPDIEVLNLGGSVDKGITIRLLLENPTPILKVLSGLPEVKSVSDEPPSNDKLFPSRQSPEDEPVRRILVITKD